MTAQEIERRQQLTDKLHNGTLASDEVAELKTILEKERDRAIYLDDWMALYTIHYFLWLLNKRVNGY